MANVPPQRSARGSASGPVRLFHGTTLSAARRVEREGWLPRDMREVVADVATEHGREAREVWAELAGQGQAYATQDGRGRWASFALRHDVAALDWAQRAPEIRREALWAVWRLENPGRAADWPVHTDGHLFVLRHLADDQPAVVEVSFDYDELVALGAMSGGFHLRPLLPEDMLRAEAVRIPEVAIPAPLPPPPGLRVHEVERAVDWDVFALLLGLERDEFVEQAEAGAFGPKMPVAFLSNGSASWPLPVVEAELHRRGLPVPWQSAPGGDGRKDRTARR